MGHFSPYQHITRCIYFGKCSQTLFVKSIYSCTDSCSGRLVKRGSANIGESFPNICFMPLRIILRRIVKTVLTMRRNSFSSQPSSALLLRVKRMTALFTLGGGLKTFSSTVKRYSTSYHACINTLSTPYDFVPGLAAMRSATSF